MPALGPQNCDFELVTKHHTFQGGAACGFGVNNDTVGEDADFFFLWDMEAGRCMASFYADDVDGRIDMY